MKFTSYTGSTLRKLLMKQKDPVSFMKLTVVNRTQFTSVDLNCLYIGVQMNTKYLTGIANLKRIELRNTVGKEVTISTRIRRKLFLGKAD